jgi:CBS domain-containing protein
MPMAQATVSEVMSSRPVQHRPPGTSVRAAAQVMAAQQVSSLLVVERDRLVGILTHSDVVRRVLAPGLDPALTLVAEVMTRDPETVAPDQPVRSALRMMDAGRYRHLPVVDEAGRLVGMLTRRECPLEERRALAEELATRQLLAERVW